MGSSSSSRAADEANRVEAERRANIEAANKQVESIFGSPQREFDIQDFISATRDFLQGKLNRTQDRNARNLKFSLARAGQGGGSLQRDKGRDLAESFLRASVDSERRAQRGGAGLRSADQASKLGLFSQILGGLDIGTAAQNSAAALRQNVSLARNTATEGNFDDFFKQLGIFNTQSREAAGERQISRQFGTLYAPRQTRTVPVAGQAPGGF